MGITKNISEKLAEFLAPKKVVLRTSFCPANGQKKTQNYHAFSPQNPTTPLKKVSKNAPF
jgi:hypothetical protein